MGQQFEGNLPIDLSKTIQTEREKEKVQIETIYQYQTSKFEAFKCATSDWTSKLKAFKLNTNAN